MSAALEAETTTPLGHDLCWLLSQASYNLSRQLTSALEVLGVTPRQHVVLVTAMTGAYTQIELARMVGLDKTTMVVTLDELEARGLAERRPSSTDRRARVVVVTKEGERMVAQAEKIFDGVRENVLGALEPDERRVFLSALSRLVAERLSEPGACAQPMRRRAPRP